MFVLKFGDSLFGETSFGEVCFGEVCFGKVDLGKNKFRETFFFFGKYPVHEIVHAEYTPLADRLVRKYK